MAFVSYTTEDLKKRKSKTDWQRVVAMRDEDIAYDEDSPSLATLLASGEVKIVRRGRPPVPEPKEKVTLRVEASALRALRATGKGWQTRLSDQISKWALPAK
ncbi:MAG: BrnA antitoxin family protein [Acidobacteriota bacterium]|jgi:uncharacterized protein (DUF4415 family)|nr:BrnA antitoxin family protein [Acidobacteriota bacterium]